MLDVTCSHTLQMTQLQSSLMADVDIYYTKSKKLEEEVDKKKATIHTLTEKISHLERNVQHQRLILAQSQPKYTSVSAATVTSDTDKEECDGSDSRVNNITTNTTTTSASRELLVTPPPCSPSSALHTESLNCGQIHGQLQSLKKFSPTSFSFSNVHPPPHQTSSSPITITPNMCEGLTLNTVQLWNENLRVELQRVHLEQEANMGRVHSLQEALAQREEERSQAEEHCEALQDQVVALVSSKEQVLGVVRKVQDENAELKNTLRRMKHL